MQLENAQMRTNVEFKVQSNWTSRVLQAGTENIMIIIQQKIK